MNQPVELFVLNKSKIDAIILRCCQVLFPVVVGFLCPYLIFCIDNLCDGIGLVTGVIFEILMQSMWVDSLYWQFILMWNEEAFLMKGGQYAITRHLPRLLFPANVFEFLIVKYSQLPLHAWLRRHFLKSHHSWWKVGPVACKNAGDNPLTTQGFPCYL